MEHAPTLGRGSSWLGRCGQVLRHHEQTLRTMCRCTELQPLLPAAHMARGLSAEARGAYTEAAEEYGVAQALLQQQISGGAPIWHADAAELVL